MKKNITHFIHFWNSYYHSRVIVGWFFEHAQSFRRFMLKIASEYVYSKDKLDIFGQNEKIVITKEHPDFDCLLSKWPKLSVRDQVEYIGRSIAYFEFGPRNKADFELLRMIVKKKKSKKDRNTQKLVLILKI